MSTLRNVTLMVAAAAVTFTFARCAKAETLRIGPYVPAVPGIEANAPRYSPYPGPVRRFAPSADVIELHDTAPGNACPTPAFEVISGPRAARGCSALR